MFKEKRRVRNCWKLEACRKLLKKKKKLIFIKNCNVGNNLKIGDFEPKMAVW